MLQRLSSTDKKEVELVLGRDSVIQEAVFWTECHITSIFLPFAIDVNLLLYTVRFSLTVLFGSLMSEKNWE